MNKSRRQKLVDMLGLAVVIARVRPRGGCAAEPPDGSLYSCHEEASCNG